MAKPDLNPGSGSDRLPNQMMLRRTLFLMTVCGIVAFIILAGRLFQLQVLQHQEYEELAMEQQLRDATLTASRGMILDRNGNILAQSASVETIFISPKEIAMDSKNPNETPEFIADNLSMILGVDKQKILDMCADTSSWYKTVKSKVEPELSDQVQAFKNQYKLKGVHLEPDSKRYYPHSSLAAQVIGFVGMDNIGLSGIEAKYNSDLSGVNGRIVRMKNGAGTDMLFTKYEDFYDAQDGDNVTLTLDTTIQSYMEKELEQAVNDFDVQNGAAAIAMDVKTGAILGMVSLGNFDLNNYQQVDQAAQDQIAAAPTQDAKNAILNAAQQAQWRNKAIMDTYEPGSTFKIITLSMALDSGAVSMNDHFYDGGSIAVLGRTTPVNCWKAGGHGDQTLTQAVEHSCNVAFVQIGEKVGEQKFYEYAQNFGLFAPNSNADAQLSGITGIDLGGEAGSIWWPKNVFEDPENLSQLAAASFGQTFNITPIQLITAVSACVNGGYLMKPYVVDEVAAPDGTVLTKNEPTVVRQVISEQTSKEVCGILEQVVGDSKEGTGKNAYVAGYRIGGKTGTSTNTVLEAATGQKHYIVSFIGVAPMDDPQIAVLVLLDDPSSSTGIYISGGQMAAPVVGKIMSEVLPYMGVKPIYSAADEKIVDKAVPDVKSESLDDAANDLESVGLNYRVIGNGDTVTAQLPLPGAVVAAGSEIILYAGAEPSGNLETIPNLSGMSYDSARLALGALGLFVRSASGSAGTTSTTVVEGQ
ncbi:MAG: penicillin-binding transpeptidase domain-containing protein, partial [Firmicutes bacterium]|nr:penicillin-binding transpeptidase domain-containing protein [Bacillota bacterium]